MEGLFQTKVFLCFFIPVALFISGCQNSGGTRPVYGKDTREELTVGGPMLCLAGSATAAIFRTEELEPPAANKQWRFAKPQSLASRGWCEKERFSDQTAMAHCTGFLIAPDIVVTAGHCVNSPQDPNGLGLNCEAFLIVFDYRMGIDGLATDEFPESSVYRCREVLAGAVSVVGEDWRVVQLDRPTNRVPLALHRGERPSPGTELIVIGHPLGLPMKSAKGRVRSNDLTSSQSVFVADIDTFSGNSGSPVLMRQGNSLEVVGLLTGGHNDVDTSWPEQACKTSLVCDEASQCSGELITASSLLWAWSDDFKVEQGGYLTETTRCAWCNDAMRSRHWQCPVL